MNLRFAPKLAGLLAGTVISMDDTAGEPDSLSLTGVGR
jgi:hypothetical protein